MWGWRAGWPCPTEALLLPQGEYILRQLQTLAPRGVKVRIAVSKPSGSQPQADLQAMMRSGEPGAVQGELGLGLLSKPAPDHHSCRLQVPRSAW